MPEYTLVLHFDDGGSVQLTCDECGHVEHWASGIELEEIIATADDHTASEHSPA
jgi:hypothetical protein